MGVFDKLFKKSDLKKRITINGKSMEINPIASLHSRQGFLNYENGNYAAAIDEYSKAIEATDKNQNFYIMRGTAHIEAGDQQSAKDDFDKAISIEPTSYLANFRLGMLFFKNKNYKESIECLRIAFDNCADVHEIDQGFNGSNILYVEKKVIASNLGNFLTMINKTDEGLHYLDIAINIDPNYSNPYLVKGLTLSRLGQFDNAIELLEKCRILGHPSAEKAIAMVYKQARDILP